MMPIKYYGGKVSFVQIVGRHNARLRGTAIV